MPQLAWDVGQFLFGVAAGVLLLSSLVGALSFWAGIGSSFAVAVGAAALASRLPAAGRFLIGCSVGIVGFAAAVGILVAGKGFFP